MIAEFENVKAEPGRGSASSLCPIVGIGVPAGGVEHIRHLLRRIPPDTGMAFVFVQPLATAEIATLPVSSSMPVLGVGKPMPVAANHIYMAGADTVLQVNGSVAELVVHTDPPVITSPPGDGGGEGSIDRFLRSLAESCKTSAIGVLLAGTGFDGLAGLQAIREEGGIGIVQRKSSSLEEIAAELTRIASSPPFKSPAADGLGLAPAFLRDPEHQARLFQLLRGAMDVDFSGCEPDTILRRVACRIAAAGHQDFESWLIWLRRHPREMMAMCQDLLLHVTGLSPEDESFDLFRRSILPRLLDTYEASGGVPTIPFRVWVPGCSIGREAYSIAMCLAEAREERGASFSIQISGTDPSEQAITIAREGIYAESEVQKLSRECGTRFFVPVGSRFQVAETIREMCVFSRRNLLAEPLFSGTNLIVCRGILLWLPQAMRREAIAAFHYALQPRGCLWLGRSESLPVLPELFSSVDIRRWFFLKEQTAGTGLPLSSREPASEAIPTDHFPPETKTANLDSRSVAERIILSEFAPASVLLNENFEIVQTNGELDRWLDLPAGPAAASLPRVARDGIRGHLTALLNDVANGRTPGSSTILPAANDSTETRIEIRRIACGPYDDATLASTDAFLVVFLPTFPPASSQLPPPVKGAACGEPIDIIERSESSYARLRNQNDALETFQEDWLANNEELSTVNEELQNRNEDLARLSDDLASLLSSTTIPILMLDGELHIRRVTPAAQGLFGIREIDVGRPIGEIRLRIREEDLHALVRRVIDTQAGEDVEILDHDGRWHLLRIRPYRTAGDRIEGAVLAMIDIDQMRRARNIANSAREFAESLIESVQTPLLVLDRDLRVRMANPIFLAVYGLRPRAIKNQLLETLGNSQWNSAELTAALQRLAKGQTLSEDLEVQQQAGSGEGPRSSRIVMINARRIGREDSTSDGPARAGFRILLAVADITSQRRAEKIMLDEQERLRQSVQESEQALRRNREELRALTASLLNAQDEERRRVSRELHDDVSQNLARLQFDIEMLEQNLRPELTWEKSRLLQISEGFGQLSNELRRIAYALHPSTLDHLGLAVALRGYCREFAKRSGIRVKFTAARVPAQFAPEIASSLYRITQEALRNSAKHAPDSTVAVRLSGTGTELKLTVRDSGPGFDREAVRGKGGLGLISMQERARLIHAVLQLATEPGAGTSITVAAPLS